MDLGEKPRKAGSQRLFIFGYSIALRKASASPVATALHIKAVSSEKCV